MQITKTTDPQAKPAIIMVVYGNGGVGKTTFASTAPKPLLVDCEGGAKYFGLRGIEMDVVNIKKFDDMQGLIELARTGQYETIIIDPIGELMEKLKIYMKDLNNRMYTNGTDGAPTMAGWGFMKDKMRERLKGLRDAGCNVLIVAHVTEQEDEGKILKRPMLMTKLSDELVNMVDIVGYMEVIKVGEEEKRVIRVDSASDKYIAKDRTGQLGKIIPPNFAEIVQACQGTKKFKWSSEKAITKEGVVDETTTLPKKPSAKKSSVNDKIAKAKKGEKVEEVVEDDGSDPNAVID